VLIADDHPQLRRSLRAQLSDSGFDVVAEAATSVAAVTAARRERPDLCLVDAFMPGDGLLAIGRIRRELPWAAIVVMTAVADEANCVSAFHSGADGYLLKDIPPSRLTHVLRDVLAGHPAIPRAYSGAVLDSFRRRWPRPLRRRP
jgi:DNA-binding NarL/FixJ family response regulator